MAVLIIRQPATREQMDDMLAELGRYVKLAVDVERGILAGGGALHADCEQALLEDGSRQEDVWGADWEPGTRRVYFESLINIRPRQQNFGMGIEDEALRAKIESTVRSLLEVE